MALTERQQRFVDAYLKDPNATEAAKVAGYSEKTAYSQGQRLLKNVEVEKQLQGRRKKAEKRTEVTVDWVVSKLKTNVERAMQEVEVLDSEGEGIGEYRYAGNVANKALELLGKYLGMFLDNSPDRAPPGLPEAATYRGVDMSKPKDGAGGGHGD